MSQPNTFILFMELCLIIRITKIQSTSWNYNQDLSAKINDYHLDNTSIDTQPFNEGFILLNGKPKKPSDGISKLNVVNRTSTIYKTSTVVKTTTDTSSPELSYVDSSSIQTPRDDDDDGIGSFLKINHEELVNSEAIFDGSGDTTEPTSGTTTTSNELITSQTITTSISNIIPVDTVLSGNSTFMITVDCTNASFILANILEEFNKTFPYWYSVTYNGIPNSCPRSSNIIITITFFTDNNVTILNILYQTLANIASRTGITLESFNKCGTNEIVPVKNVTSCYLIDLCNLCGINPRRGICLPEYNVSKCQCFANQNNPTISYTDEFCKIQQTTPTSPISSSSSSWSSIIIGILASIAGIFCITTIFLLVRHRYRRSENGNSFDFYLPKNENPQPILVDLSSDNTSIISVYDPINELDAIIDNEDISIGLDNEVRF